MKPREPIRVKEDIFDREWKSSFEAIIGDRLVRKEVMKSKPWGRKSLEVIG